MLKYLISNTIFSREKIVIGKGNIMNFEKTHVIANANAKGGIGKTTNSLGLCYALSHLGFDVLLLDGDPQASSTSDLRMDLKEDSDLNTIDKLITPVLEADFSEYRELGYRSQREYWNDLCDKTFNWKRISEFIYTPTYEKMVRIGTKWQVKEFPFGDNLARFDILPSSIDLSVCDLKMGTQSRFFGGHINPNYFQMALDPIKEQKIYDFIVIDLPPQVSSISINMLRSAQDGVILNSNLDLQSIRGFKSIIASISDLQESFPEHRGILGILFSMYSAHRSTDKTIEEIAKDFVPIPIFDARIPDTSDARKAILSNKLLNQINRRAETAYTDFAMEIINAMRFPDKPIGTNKKIEK